MSYIGSAKFVVRYRYRGEVREKVVEAMAFDEGDRVSIAVPVLCAEECHSECMDNDLYGSIDVCIDECVDNNCSSPDEEVGEYEEYVSREEFDRRYRHLFKRGAKR